MLRILLFLTVKFILGVESGASFPWSSKWQDKKSWYSEIPEILDAAILAFIAHDVYQNFGLDVEYYWDVLIWLCAGGVSYAGIQSATWMFLQWEGHDNPETTRTSTTKPFVDRIAAKFGWSLGDEGYSWVAATVKGSIICLPFVFLSAPIGGLMFAFGYEIGSWFKRKGRDKYLPRWLKPHAVAEGMSFVGIGLFALAFVETIKFINA